MVTDIKIGLRAALDGLSEARTPAGNGEAGDPADQAEPPDPVAAGEIAQYGLFGETPAAEPKLPATAGAGRPAGARNKRTGKIGDYVMALGYRHPALILADLANVEPARLREFGLKPNEAMQLKRQAAADLMPYFESKMPVGVTGLGDGGEEYPMILLGEIRARSAARDGAMGLDDPVEEIEPDQGLSGGDGVRPDGGQSHEDS